MNPQGAVVKPTSAVLIAIAVLATLEAAQATAQNYPSKPIRIVTAAAGGGIDFAARAIAHGYTAALGQQAIVDNRGGSAVVAADLVANATPDGHTLLYYGSGAWLAPFMGGKVPYDPVRSFAPITLSTSAPNVLVVNPSLPFGSVKELVAYGKAKPGALSYASAGSGGSSHLAGELFKSVAGVDILRIAYRGTAPALTGVAAGEVNVMFSQTTAALPFIRSGKLKALAMTTLKPSPLLPGVPTIAESGVPGYEASSINGLFAPAGTPRAIVNRLNQEAVRTLNQPEVKEKFAAVGVDTVGSTPEQLLQTIKAEMAKYGKLIQQAAK